MSDYEELVGGLLGDCLTCEELSGGFSQGMMVLVLGGGTHIIQNLNLLSFPICCIDS